MRVVGKFILPFLLLLAFSVKGGAQTQGGGSCTELGQNPSTAFPVCGATVFTQTHVPLCSNAPIPSFCENNVATTQATVNPYWYKFTCYAAGTLGFVITPLATFDEDYDWQLFDVTGRDPNDVFKDPRTVVTNNWAGTYGTTGASDKGQLKFTCGSQPEKKVNTFAVMPQLQVGHEYLLVISHFLLNSTSEVGYTLEFKGGTASIVNPVTPRFEKVRAICDGQEMSVKLTSRINCKTIAANGSDFKVTGPVTRNVVSATGYGCSTGFDTDSITLAVDNILPPGTFTISSKIGDDGNTLKDNCDNALPVDEKGVIDFKPPAPVPMDSIMPVDCVTDRLRLVFSRPLLCNSIAADGSDFTITGPMPVTVKSAAGSCVGGQTSSIEIILAQPITVNGKYTVTLNNGSDGNPLVDECGQVTAAGATISFSITHIVYGDFTVDVRAGCKSDTVYFSHNGNNGTDYWNWMLDQKQMSSLQKPVLISTAYGKHDIQLAISNGYCTDTVTRQFTFIDQTVKAAFEVEDTLCATDTLHFTDRSSPNTTSWNWNFGNGVTSTLQSPPAQNYPDRGRQVVYTARLSARNNFNCSDTAYKLITVLQSCYIAVPSAFTPNGDGLNDYLYPLNAFKADHMTFRVFNRYGQVLFQTADWTKKWDGRYNGTPQPSGTYVWMLEYTDRDTGKKVSLKGTVVLIR